MPARRLIAVLSASLLSLSAVLTTGSSSFGDDEPAAGAAARDSTFYWRITPTGSVDEFRGLAAVNRGVAWVSGEQGTVLKTVTGGRGWRDVSPAAASDLALRDIEAWNRRRAVALSIGPGTDSRVYSTTNGGRTWTETFRNRDDNAFYDCMAFNGHGRGLALSDPVDGRFRLAVSRDRGSTWRVLPTTGMPAARTGEFAFAASGTCIVAGNHGRFWFVTGGIDRPRLFSSQDGGRTWTASGEPMRGGPSAGIYSVDFLGPNRAVMVGGDYVDETDGTRAAAYLSPRSDGFQSSVTPVGGYRSGVAWVQALRHTAVAVGPSGSDVSTDGGRTWTTFDDVRYDGVQCVATGACWASGTYGRVAKLRLPTTG